MSMTKQCPQCQAEHPLRVNRCGCGYVWTPQNKPEPARDPMLGCCSYSAGSARCHYPGTYTLSLKGDGRLYCSAHAAGVNPDQGALIVYRSHEEFPNPDWSAQAVRERYEQRVQREVKASRSGHAMHYSASEPGKGWAHALMRREAGGEQIAVAAQSAWRDALGLPLSISAADAVARFRSAA